MEIRTAPVVQVSMSISVSLDEFFSVGRLIENIAFALNINPNRIRVVKYVLYYMEITIYCFHDTFVFMSNVELSG